MTAGPMVSTEPKNREPNVNQQDPTAGSLIGVRLENAGTHGV